jgi:hypothetical protein
MHVFVYIILFTLKSLLGCLAIAVYMDHPESKQVGIFTGCAIGITISQYLIHYF